MTHPFRAAVCLLLLFSLPSACQATKAATRPDLQLRIKPTAPTFTVGSDVTLEFSLRNITKRGVLATREASIHDLIYLDVLDDHGRQVAWQGKIVNRSYPPGFFVVLNPGESITFRAVISHSNGSGYQINKPGSYRVQADFSLAPKEYFAPVSNGAVIPDRSVKSNWARFSLVDR